jgi:hypothetical protein
VSEPVRVFGVTYVLDESCSQALDAAEGWLVGKDEEGLGLLTTCCRIISRLEDLVGAAQLAQLARQVTNPFPLLAAHPRSLAGIAGRTSARAYSPVPAT